MTGEPFSNVANSTSADIELALDAAHAAKDAWGATSPAERAEVLNAMADAIEENLQMLAIAESWYNVKPVRETLAADILLVIDHLRYFAGAVRAEEGPISEVDKDTVAYHFHQPLGVVFGEGRKELSPASSARERAARRAPGPGSQAIGEKPNPVPGNTPMTRPAKA
ncbi:MAG TPA: aldehyde dehydrogenase family protein [Solirubrobacterales bacterium]|nr:aldehyde dehydrogenase family protein [Solirubrobacterales bacterium]